MTDMADSDFHDYINFEYYLQNIGKYRNSYLIHTALSSSDSDLFVCYSVYGQCSFAICDEQRSVFSLVLLLKATHCTVQKG